MALPYHLYVISTQVPGMPLEIQYGTALVLLALVLSMNLVATMIRSYFPAAEGMVSEPKIQPKIQRERQLCL
jgi:ABC-type phosphate transport system permease subunit